MIMRHRVILLGILASFALLTAACLSRSDVEDEITPLPETTALNYVFTPTSIQQVPEFTATATVQPSLPRSTYEGVPAPLMGVEVRKLNSPNKFEELAESGMTIFRHNGLQWSEVESNEGERDWGAVEALEKGLVQASEADIDIILIIRSTPMWAQKEAGYFCGPIAQDKLQSFAQFMKDLVSRYSQPPYNVKYWELWNEPDVAAQLVQVKSVFGCWGDSEDPFYGGGYYAEMLKAAYPAIKAADPQAQVLIGGLLLDCDPTHPPEGKDCKPSRFLEGILNNGGGEYFDIVSFHGYPPYSGSAKGGGLYYDEHFGPWEHRGGVVLGKVSFLREVLSGYGLDKPIMHTEGSLICPENTTDECDPPGDAFYQAQADYVVWLFIRNWAVDVKGTIWYQYEGPGWRFGSMVGEDGQSKPALDAFRFLTSELGGAEFIQEVIDYPDLRAYEFSSDEKKIWVLWSPDGQSYSVSVPPGTTRVVDTFGNELQINQGYLNILRPVYLELSP